MKISKTSKMVYMALLVAMALILSLIERTLPIPFIAPGARLGLANLVIMLSIYTLDSYKDSFIVLMLRIFLATMLGGSLSNFLYSCLGGLFSFFIAVILKESLKEKVSIIGVSSAAAVFHNIGQLLVASLIFNNIHIFLYLPLLTISGIGTGIFVGLSANYILNHLTKLPYFKGAVSK